MPRRAYIKCIQTSTFSLYIQYIYWNIHTVRFSHFHFYTSSHLSVSLSLLLSLRLFSFLPHSMQARTSGCNESRYNSLRLTYSHRVLLAGEGEIQLETPWWWHFPYIGLYIHTVCAVCMYVLRVCYSLDGAPRLSFLYYSVWLRSARCFGFTYSFGIAWLSNAPKDFNWLKRKAICTYIRG